MLNATNASNATNATKSAATAAVVKEVVNLQSSSMAAKYNIQRVETKTGTLDFSMVF